LGAMETPTPQLGRYVIQSELGRGAMGVVYKALDSVLERVVAVKTVNMALEQDGADRYEARFYQEAKAAAGLNHPNIVTVHDVGIARRRVASDLTQTGMLLGSPKYMSPEQVIGKRADQRSDIFSLGVILYEMLCGAAPFNGENVTALMYQTVNFMPPPPSAINDAVPQLLDYIVAKMIAKPLEERYQDATEVARDLHECERQLAGVAATQSRPGTTNAPAPEPKLVDGEAKTIVL